MIVTDSANSVYQNIDCFSLMSPPKIHPASNGNEINFRQQAPTKAR